MGRREGRKKLSALTDSGVVRGVLAKVKRASAASGERKRRGGKKATRCSVFPLANAPSQLVKLHPAYLPFPPVPIRPSLSLALSLTLEHNLWSTPDLESYLYDICVHYLAQGVQGTGISSRDELRHFVGGKREEERARVPSLSASEELIQPPETSSFHDLPRSGKNNFPGFPPLSPRDPPFPEGVMLKNSRRYLLR